MYTQEQLDKYVFFPVSKVKVLNTHRILDDKYGKVLSVVSENYKLVPNAEVVKPFIDHFGIERLEKVTIFNARRSYAFEFNTGREFDFDGDRIRERLVIRNSYDKTKTFSFMFGAFRFVCSNGLYYAVNSAVVYRKIHVGEIPVSEIINKAINNYSQNDFEFYKKLLSIPLNLDQEIELVNQWQPFESKYNRVYMGNANLNSRINWTANRLIKNPESKDNQRNAWGLYNQMNQAIRRNVTTSQFNKKILGDQRALEFLGETFSIN